MGARKGLYVTSLLDAAMATGASRADEFARHAEDRVDVRQIYARPLPRPLSMPRRRTSARRLRATYDAVLASHDLLLMPTVADEGDADSSKRRDAAGDHPAKLGADAEHLPVQRHRPPRDQPAVRNGGRPADRDDAGRAPLRRGHDLPRRGRVRARGRLDDVLTLPKARACKRLTSSALGPRRADLWPFAEISVNPCPPGRNSPTIRVRTQCSIAAVPAGRSRHPRLALRRRAASRARAAQAARKGSLQRGGALDPVRAGLCRDRQGLLRGGRHRADDVDRQSAATSRWRRCSPTAPTSR